LLLQKYVAASGLRATKQMGLFQQPVRVMD
jgi:hypothetical protein